MSRVLSILAAIALAILICCGDKEPKKYGDIISGGGLSRVFHDGTCTGSGTQSAPLSCAGSGGGGSGTLQGSGSAGWLAAWTGSATLGNYAGTTCASHKAETATGSNGSATCAFFIDTAGVDLYITSNSTLNVGIPTTSCGSGSAVTAIGSNGSGTCTAVGGGGTITPTISISQAVTTGTPNLTTLGTKDWMANGQNTPKSGYPVQNYSRLTGGNVIQYPTWTGSFFNIATNSRTQQVTWTTSDNLAQVAGPLSGVNTGFNNSGIVGWGFVTGAPSDTSSGTFTIYVGNFNETDGVTCTANFEDNEVSPQSVSFTMSGVDNRTVTTTFQSARATKLVVQCILVSNPAGSNLGWLAMWLA